MTLVEYKNKMVAQLTIEANTKRALADQVKGEIIGLEEAIEMLEQSDTRAQMQTGAKNV